MLKINKSILIICMISLFLIIGQISASDTDSMKIEDLNDTDSIKIEDLNAIDYDRSIDNIQEMDNSIEINGKNDETIEINGKDDEPLRNNEKRDESIELFEDGQKDTTGIVMANDNYSCGPASLATVLNKNGLNLSLNEVSQHTNTSLDGTSMQSLIDAAKYYKFTAYGVEMETHSLKENCIVQLNINGDEHWTVITKVTDNHVFLADSTLGNMNLSINEFNSYFSKKAIVISKENPDRLKDELISNQVNILDKDQCKRISGKGLKRKVIGYRIVWRYGLIRKYGWVLRPKVVGGHVSFSQWTYVKGYYAIWGKYKVKEPIYKYYFVSDDALTSAKIRK